VILDLELRQARYEASLAERRYAACDPDNRLIAAQLEKNWEAALRRVRDLEERGPTAKQSEIEVDPKAFANLAENLSEAWNAQGVTMRTRQQLLRALIVDIIVDVDDKTRVVMFTVHWRGGQHSELRVRKPRAGEHGCATTEDALAVIRTMAGAGPPTMCTRHVLGRGRVPVAQVRARVARNPFACVKDLDRLGGDAHIDNLADQPRRHRVNVTGDLDLIVGRHARPLPLRADGAGSAAP
jgi:hypothetical protein